MPNKLPHGWLECQLSEVFETSSGGTPKRGNSEYYQNGTIPWLKSGELNNSIISSAEEFITEEGLNNSSAKIFPKGSLLIALYGATVGKLGILDFDSATNQAVCCIYQNAYYNGDFLFYYLLFKKEYLVNQGKGGAQPNISQEIVKSLLIPFPPLNEQRRIVEKIESEFAKIDEGLGHLEQAKEQIKQYRQSVLKSAFEGKLCKISEWQDSDLESISKKITDGSHFSPKTVEKSNYPYITVKDLNNGTIDFENCKFIALEDYTELKKNGCKPQQGDVLFSKDGTVGKVALIDFQKNFVVLSSLAIIRPNQDIIKSEYLKYALSNPDFLQIALNKKTGVAIRRIILRTLKQLKICYPKNKSEQKQIVEEIEKRFAVADEVEKVVEDNIEKAKQLKQSILKKAFEGRLVPQNTTDEPASTLLEKIKQERSKKK